jgi:signal transduction histidine kinase
MDQNNTEGPRSKRGALLAGLARLNGELSAWAAAMSWWRLVVLFLVVLVAAAMIGDQLGLKHRRVIVNGNETVQIGPNGIHITRKAPAKDSAVDAPPAPTGGDSARALPPRIHDDTITVDANDEDLPEVQRVFTVRGLLGDIGATLIILLFAYLVASKILVRKVAESDAKVRSAVDAAGREAMERQLVQARLQVLQAQVEPHFLFNTLAAVDYLIETDPPRASHMQKSLIAYLRSALPQMRQHSSTLGREVSLVRAYLELIRMRIEERLEFRIEVPPGLESAEFPPMMLQSIVENAIKHGIEPKPEGGSVTVSARIADGRLCVEVRDSGVGIVDIDTLRGPTSGTGLGLQNIRERLAVLYPGRSRLALWSDDAVGTRVQIDIPYVVGQPPAGAGAADERS